MEIPFLQLGRNSAGKKVMETTFTYTESSMGKSNEQCLLLSLKKVPQFPYFSYKVWILLFNLKASQLIFYTIAFIGGNKQNKTSRKL